eukprot:1027035-Amphidinium_carterae.1
MVKLRNLASGPILGVEVWGNRFCVCFGLGILTTSKGRLPNMWCQIWLFQQSIHEVTCAHFSDLWLRPDGRLFMRKCPLSPSIVLTSQEPDRKILQPQQL